MVRWGSAAALGVAYSDPMTSPAHCVRYSWAEYLALEATSNVKHEFLDGQIYAMAGGTPEHAALKAAVTGLLFAQIRAGSCRAHDADLRVRVLATGLATYPDVTVVCGRRERDPADENAVVNPTVIVEVLSDGTETYDRGEKFEHYQRIDSLRQYVLVSHRDHEIEVWTRTATHPWTKSVAREGERALLESIGAVLDVTEVYEAADEPRA
jgi:Uma2 family endonuclease